MRKLYSSLLLLVTAMPAFADPVIPEPGTISLVALGIGAAIWVATRKKK